MWSLYFWQQHHLILPRSLERQQKKKNNNNSTVGEEATDEALREHADLFQVQETMKF